MRRFHWPVARRILSGGRVGAAGRRVQEYLG